MSRSDFYVLPSPAPEARMNFLYKLLEKILKLGRRVYIKAESEEQARMLDTRLWDYQDQAFIPHSLVAEGLASPLEIGYGDAKPDHCDVYLNFALDIADEALKFDRIIEIVVQEPRILESTRNNYRRYKQAGYDIHMNDMRRKI